MEQIVKIKFQNSYIGDFLRFNFGVRTKNSTRVVVRNAYLNLLIKKMVVARVGGHKNVEIEDNAVDFCITVPKEMAGNLSMSPKNMNKITTEIRQTIFLPIFVCKIDSMIAQRVCLEIQDAIELFMINNGINLDESTFRALEKLYYRHRKAYSDIILRQMERNYILAPLVLKRKVSLDRKKNKTEQSPIISPVEQVYCLFPDDWMNE